MDEDYIKFNCNWIPSNNISLDKVAALNVWRDIMYKKGLIGVYYKEGIISFRKDLAEAGTILIDKLRKAKLNHIGK